MIKALYINGKNDLNDAFYVREQVFVKEQNIDTNLVFDDLDNEAIHVVVYENNMPVGSGRIIRDNDEYLIGRIGVLQENRGKDYGDLIVRMLIQKGFDMGANQIVVHSQLPPVPFYKKIGFKEVGEIYEEASIEHITMILVKENLIKNCHNKK